MKYCRFCICVLLLFTLFVSTIAQNTQPVTVSGNKVTKNFIKTHIDFPEKDLKNKVQGTVKIKFLTDKLGNVISYNVVQKVSPEIDSSAVSIFKLIL
ncbi:MAG: energy transducer TonB, partial [Bacteroidetes bacterium]|nr:energy transducer TonB [Bacteroidota bacterium]